MPRAFEGSGFSENRVLNNWAVRSIVFVRCLASKAYEEIRGFRNRFTRWKSIGSYAQAALPKSISIRLFDEVI
jgi:hypothetical protein